MVNHILVIGCGLAGISAAIRCAERNNSVTILAPARPDRSQSVLAAGGINAALNTKDQHDSPAEHAEDTLRAGVFLADPAAVAGLTNAAPELVANLGRRGIVFNRDRDGNIDLRAFGGQKKMRTAFSRSGIGRQLIAGLSAELMRHEAAGNIRFLDHHRFVSPVFQDARCIGAIAQDTVTGDHTAITAEAVIAASGGLGGLFPKHTGSSLSDGSVSAALFRKGVEMANLEMNQFHPTTVETPAKHMLISESARGEGGRLFTFRNKERWYFMEEWYPELGNLMPRDVVSRSIYQVCHDLQLGINGKNVVGLQLEHLPKKVLNERLREITELCQRYLHLDPAKEYIAVSPAVHYFMGGIAVDRFHRTSVSGLYAAGECACQYHGANRLGGNSTLGAIYGGQLAAETASAECIQTADADKAAAAELTEIQRRLAAMNGPSSAACRKQKLQEIMNAAMGIVRTKEELEEGLARLAELEQDHIAAVPRHGSEALAAEDLLFLGKAMILSALARKESRGAHWRSDYPYRNDEEFHKTILTRKTGPAISLRFAEVGRELR